MSEWWTYTLTDFLLFSPRTYYRLFELYNAAVWPLQLVTLALGVAILILMLRGGAWSGRVVAAILAALWLLVAWAYLLERYDTINWAARYFAIGFAVQAALLVWTGVVRDRLRFDADTATGKIGIALLIYALRDPPAHRAAHRPLHHPSRNLRPRARSDRRRDTRHSACERAAVLRRCSSCRCCGVYLPAYALDDGIARGACCRPPRPACACDRNPERLGPPRKTPKLAVRAPMVNRVLT